MYGSPVSNKDLNLPAVQLQPATGTRPPPPPPRMSSPGLLRYRSAPSNLLGEVCAEDFGYGAEGGGGVAGHSHAEIGDDCKPPRPAAAAHFLDDHAASMASQHNHHHHQQQQQIMYQSQQQQQIAAMEGLYRTLSSSGTEHAAVGSGNNNLVRQSSSPAGFLNHLNMDSNGYGNMLRAGMASGGFSNGGGDHARLKGKLSYSSSRQGSVMSQISEMGSEELGGSSPEAAARCYSGGIPAGAAGYPMDGGGSSGWDDASPAPDHQGHLPGVKRPRDPARAPPMAPNGHHHLAPQLSLPSNGKTSAADMAGIEKFLHFHDAVPCKIRAKRGCATHPRSIAERVRRTRISERIRKLQELVPNMEKQTNTADMLDLAVDYIKDLQKEVEVLNDSRANCTCSGSKRRSPFTC